MNEIVKQWFRERVNAIHEKISAYDVLRMNGIDLHQAGDTNEEQFSCPFHGLDKKPSARVYPEEGSSRSHVWCFVCQEPHWDAIGLWRKFNNDLPFSQALSAMERALGLTTPETPKNVAVSAAQRLDAEEKEAFKKVLAVCERRLSSCKADYRRHDDLRGYLAAGRALDRVIYRVASRQLPLKKGTEELHTVLQRIGERART